MTKVNPTCGSCKERKIDKEFYPDRKKINGLSTYCRVCCKARAKGSYARNPERAKRSMKRWREKNPERNAFIKAKSAYGISESDFYSLSKVCTICGSRKNLCIDHSHKTGKVRGRLCSSCNRGLGQFKDDPTLLLRAGDYLLGLAKPDIFEATYWEVK